MKKKIIKFLFVLAIVGGLGYLFGKGPVEEMMLKNGWHVEILNEYLNIRVKPSQLEAKLEKQAKKGEVYKVVDVNLDDKDYFWYKIVLSNKTTGWVANPRKLTADKYLKDVNNPKDISEPKIAFKTSNYETTNIDSITYDHLITWDDKPGSKVSHVIYHEQAICSESDEACESKDQYWIQYTIKDKEGKTSTAMQLIKFEEKPDESRVLDFYEDYLNKKNVE
jgi:uncharacterized protein YgiM (DUF1202 family)